LKTYLNASKAVASITEKHICEKGGRLVAMNP
jgi:hypothetical protein